MKPISLNYSSVNLCKCIYIPVAIIHIKIRKEPCNSMIYLLSLSFVLWSRIFYTFIIFASNSLKSSLLLLLGKH